MYVGIYVFIFKDKVKINMVAKPDYSGYKFQMMWKLFNSIRNIKARYLKIYSNLKKSLKILFLEC